MAFEKIFYASNSNQNIYSEKLQKKLLFSNLKNTHSQLSLEKINVVAILDHFLAPKECNSNTQGSQKVATRATLYEIVQVDWIVE